MPSNNDVRSKSRLPRPTKIIKKPSNLTEPKGYFRKQELAKLTKLLKDRSILSKNDENNPHLRREALTSSDNSKVVPITPHKTRTGKVYSRLSTIFADKLVNTPQRLLSKPSQSFFSAKLPVIDLTTPTKTLQNPTTPTSYPLFTSELALVKEDETDRTFEDVPNLEDIGIPKPLISFNSTSDSIDFQEDENLEHPEKYESQAAVDTFNNIVMDVEKCSNELTGEIKEPVVTPHDPTDELMKPAVTPHDPTDELMKPAVANQNFDDSDSDDVKVIYSKVRIHPKFALLTSRYSSSNPTLKVPSETPKDVDIGSLAPKVCALPRETADKLVQPKLPFVTTRSKSRVFEEQSEDDIQKKSRKQRRNSVFPRKTINMMKDNGVLFSETDNTDSLPHFLEDCSQPDNSYLTSKASSSKMPNTDKSEDSSCKAIPEGSPKYEKLKKQKSKKSSPKSSNPSPQKVFESTLPVENQTVVNGKVFVSIKLPQTGKKKNLKKNLIPETIEVHSSLLIDPKESCLKKVKRQHGNDKKRFRWADDKDKKPLFIVTEFSDDEKYSFRQSTRRKSFFEPSNE